MKLMQTRRDFLKTAGKVVAGGTAMAAAPMIALHAEADAEGKEPIICSQCGAAVETENERGKQMSKATVWVHPNGRPGAAGTETDPVSTLSEALACSRALDCDTCEIVMVSGQYYVDAPIQMDSRDRHVIVRAAEDGQAELLGARPVSGWEKGELNGVEVWTKVLGPEYGYFQSLFDGRITLPRSRYPKDGYLHVKDVREEDARETWDPNQKFQQGMVADPADLRPFYALQDVTIKLLHFWKDETVNVKSIDMTSGHILFSRRMTMTVKPGDRYFFENVKEELRVPGEWYFDRETRVLYYVPREGEKPETLVLYAAATRKLLEIDGAEDVTFKGTAFRMVDWAIPEKPFQPWGSDHFQAAYDVNGAVEVRNAREIHFDTCRFENLMSTAIRFDANVQDFSVEHSILYEIGGSGIFILGENLPKSDGRVNRRFLIRDNHIYKYGRVFLNGTALAVLHACEGQILHNAIHDGYTVAITVGWVWGYGYSVTSDILVKHNHVWDVGHNVMADMAAIYTLGVKEGVVIAENIVHDVVANLKYGYGGWGIYMDEGSSNVLVTKNLMYRCNTTTFYQHYGRDNLVINNILAFGDEACASAYREQPHIGYHLIRNIMVQKNRPFISMNDLVKYGHLQDANNICWDYEKGDRKVDTDLMDRHWGLYHKTTFVDPQFVDPENDDFRLKDTSPVFDLGFIPWEFNAGTITEFDMSRYL